jgi:hypothetical protein
VALGATPPPLAVASCHHIRPQNRRAVKLSVRFCSFYRAALCPTIFHSPASVNETGGEELASSGRVKPNCDGIVICDIPKPRRSLGFGDCKMPLAKTERFWYVWP